MRKDTEYAYAVGRIRVLEKDLLDNEKLDRMIKAKNTEELFAVLNDSIYGKHASDIGNHSNYDAAINGALKETYDVLESIAPEPDVLMLFRQKYDFHNIKVILKSEFAGIDGEDLFIDVCNVPINVLKEEIKSRNYIDTPGYLVDAITQAIETFNINRDPQQIDLVVDREMFAAMKRISEETGYDFLINLVKLQIDLYNINTCVRIRNRENKQKYINNALIEGGKITLESAFFEASTEQFAEYIATYGYDGIIPEKDSSWTILEKNIDSALMNFIKKGKYIPVGIEPFVGYLLARENEAKVIRIILVGKINGFKPNEIRERIRNLYV